MPVMLPDILTAASLAAEGRLAHGFFTRRGGVSKGIYASLNVGAGSDDDATAIAENRARVCHALGAETLVTVHQIHSAEAVCVTTSLIASPRPKADAMVCALPGLALGILTADCVPVLLADAEAKVIGAAHCGWRGTHAGIVGETVDAMSALGAEPAGIYAAIGPAIQQSSYEVGDEVRETVVARDPGAASHFATGRADGKWQFDLVGLVIRRLAEAGVGHVETLNRDTYTEEDAFFSYRRATHRGEADYGRQLSAIMLRP